MTPVEWTKSHNGWGGTEYRTKVDGTSYLLHKTGGRFLGWEIRVDKGWTGDRVTSGSTMRSCKDTFERIRRMGTLPS